VTFAGAGCVEKSKAEELYRCRYMLEVCCFLHDMSGDRKGKCSTARLLH